MIKKLMKLTRVSIQTVICLSQICFCNFLLFKSIAENKFTGPGRPHFKNDLAKKMWIIGGCYLIFIFILTAILRVLCSHHGIENDKSKNTKSSDGSVLVETKEPESSAINNSSKNKIHDAAGVIKDSENPDDSLGRLTNPTFREANQHHPSDRFASVNGV